MKSLRKTWILGILALAGACDMFAGGSSEQGNAVSGGSSDQGNAIQVAVVDRTGNPVVAARLEILPEDWASTSVPDSLASRAFLKTDSLGQASVRLPEGRYTLQGADGILRGFRKFASTPEGQVLLVLNAATDIVGTLQDPGVDSLFVPGTRLAVALGADGSFRLDSIAATVSVLATRDGRHLLLDSTGSGYVRQFLRVLRLDPGVAVPPDTLIPKYYSRVVEPLPRVTSAPAEVLQSFVPDSVWVQGDTIWISTLGRSCDELPSDGIAGRRHADTLDLFRVACPSEGGVPSERVMHFESRLGVWTVNTLQPFGYTWEMP
ncbi:MAG: hypothetical protein H6686_11270 [Fibrobacteria bacterium]|nr:hypothetical protein [Fibrobacteria bacterium]